MSPEVVEGNVATRLAFVDQRPAGQRARAAERLQRAALLATGSEITAADLALPATPPRFAPGENAPDRAPVGIARDRIDGPRAWLDDSPTHSKQYTEE